MQIIYALKFKAKLFDTHILVGKHEWLGTKEPAAYSPARIGEIYATSDAVAY